MLCTPTSDWSSAEASPQLVLASGQGNGIPGITDICAPRPGSKKLHVSLWDVFYKTSFWSVTLLFDLCFNLAWPLLKKRAWPKVCLVSRWVLVYRPSKLMFMVVRPSQCSICIPSSLVHKIGNKQSFVYPSCWQDWRWWCHQGGRLWARWGHIQIRVLQTTLQKLVL